MNKVRCCNSGLGLKFVYNVRMTWCDFIISCDTTGILYDLLYSVRRKREDSEEAVSTMGTDE